MTKNNEPVIYDVMTEQQQGHPTRKKLFIILENELKRPVLTYFTSFKYPVMIDDADADMIEGVLQKMDLSRGLTLIINSPGGDGLAISMNAFSLKIILKSDIFGLRIAN